MWCIRNEQQLLTTRRAEAVEATRAHEAIVRAMQEAAARAVREVRIRERIRERLRERARERAASSAASPSLGPGSDSSDWSD